MSPQNSCLQCNLMHDMPCLRGKCLIYYCAQEDVSTFESIVIDITVFTGNTSSYEKANHAPDKGTSCN